ncbi:MAG: PDZ domain-containing protein, partial [Chloroflexota bacterium]|nr:PDZ domain-containing protein [Chloroflexota bacterium]
LARQLGANAQNGIVVGGVMPGSPAARAGLQPRDVITAADGQQFSDESSLAQILSQRQPGDTIALTVIRAGQQLSVQVTLGQAPAS